jgi:flagellar basal-body rod protein FlgB
MWKRQSVAGVAHSPGKEFPPSVERARAGRATTRFSALGMVVAPEGCGHSPHELRTTTMESILGVHEAALLFRAKRMEVLAANLANADTPRYQARDVEFSAVLDGAARQLQTTNPRHIGADALTARDSLQYRIPHQPSLDGNTVEADLELARYAENAVSYQASLLFANGKISTLRAALSGGR